MKILNPDDGTMLDAFVRSVQYGRHPKHQEITRTDLVTWTMAHPLLALQSLWTKEIAYKDKFNSSWKHWGENAPWWVWPWWAWHHGPLKTVAAIAVLATVVYLGTVL
jgi:hypothetical protein